MNMIDICKKNALLFSEKVCRLPSKSGYPFPEYFDWSDHIATPETSGYCYHLNKTAIEIERLVEIFEPYIKPAFFGSWKKEWYEQALSAAWIHDIGMLTNRVNHGITSAEVLLGKNVLEFDFNDIGYDDRIKIGMLCIKHNSGWPAVFNAMKTILQKNNYALDILEQSFEDENTPNWQLDFSGKLISTADLLRYRGKDLKNDLKQPFSLWSECGLCQAMYDKSRDFCFTTNCDSKPEPTVVIYHYFDEEGFSPSNFPDIPVYQKVDSGICNKIQKKIGEIHAHARVRNNNQLYTRGDMTLSDVRVIDFRIWLDDLTSRGLNFSDLDDFFLDEQDNTSDEYKTVIHVNLDISNHDAAMFTLSKYITAHLHQNIATEMDAPHLIFSNSTILQIDVSDGTVFSLYYKKMCDNQKLAPEIHNAILKFDKSFQQWQDLHNIVLPVELINNKVKMISL